MKLKSVRISYIGVISVLFFISFAFDPSVYTPYHFPKNFIISTLPILILLIIWFYNYLKKKKLTIRFTIIEIILFIRIIWLIITNPDFLLHPSDLGFSVTVGLILITISTRQMDAKKIQKYFFKAIILIGLAQAFIGFYQYFKFSEIPAQYLKTPMLGTIGSANGFGAFIAISIIASVVELYIAKNMKYKIIISIITIFLLLTLLFNGSRGALLGLVFSFIIIFVISILIKRNSSIEKIELFKIIKSNWKVKTITLIVLSLFLAMSTAFLILKDKESSFGRLMVWEISLPMIYENPITGIGHNRYAVEYLNYQAKYFKEKENEKYNYKASNLKQAHNEYLQAFCESGIIGGIIFFSIFLMILITLFKKYLTQNSIHQTALLLIFLYMSIHSFIDSVLHLLPISILFYVILGFTDFKKMFKFKLNKILSLFVIVILFIISLFLINKNVLLYKGYKLWQKGYETGLQRMLEPSIKYYKEALEYLKDKGELEFHLGSAMVLNKSFAEGIYYLEKSTVNFNDKNIYLSLSHAYLRQKKFSVAEYYANRALSMFPSHVAPYLLLGEIYREQGKIEQSKQSLIKCINQETTIQSEQTEQISKDARKLWEKLFGK